MTRDDITFYIDLAVLIGATVIGGGVLLFALAVMLGSAV